MKGKKNPITSGEKSVIFIGCNDLSLLYELRKAASKLPKSACIVVEMDKNLYNQTVQQHLKNIREYKENQDIKEYLSNPENIAKAQHTAEMFYKHAQQNSDRYVTLKEVVDNTNMTYSTAKEVIEMLYLFGLLAKRQNGVVNDMKVILKEEDRIAFIENHLKDLENEYNQKRTKYIEIIDNIKNKVEVVTADVPTV